MLQFIFKWPLQMTTIVTTFETHSFYEAQLDALYVDLQKLAPAANVPDSIIVPHSIQLQYDTLTISAQTPALQQLTKYDPKIWQNNVSQAFDLFLALFETGVFVHQQGCVMRQFALRNILVSERCYRVIAYYQEIEQNTLTVRCPIRYCTQDFFNYCVYIDPIIQTGDLVEYRKYLAFPATLRLRQKIRFSINCDIYSLGALLFQIVTNHEPLSPYLIKTADELVICRIQTIQELSQHPFGELFNQVVIKMLFMFEGNYYYNLLEPQQDILNIIRLTQNEKINQNVFLFNQFRQLLFTRMPFHDDLINKIIDNVLLQIPRRSIENMKVPEQQRVFSKYVNITQCLGKFGDKISLFMDCNKAIDLEYNFSNSTKGRISIVQGYFGAGKTQVLLEILQFCSNKIYCFSCYIPARDTNHYSPTCFQLHPPVSNLFSEQELQNIEIIDIQHFICIHLIYSIIQQNVQGLNEIIKNRFKGQDGFNLGTICPCFADILQIQKKKMILNHQLIDNVLRKLIKAILECCSLIVIGIDDIQAIQNQKETRFLMDLLSSIPRLHIIVTEVPYVKIHQAVFVSSGTSCGPNTQQVCDLLHYFSSDFPILDETFQKKAHIRSSSQLASVHESEISNEPVDSLVDQPSCSQVSLLQRICTNNNIQFLSCMVSYIGRTKIIQSFGQFNWFNKEIGLNIYRKSSGCTQEIKNMMQQLFQHSAFEKDKIHQNVLELIQSDEILILHSFARKVGLQQVQTHDLEVLQASSIFGYFIGQQQIQEIMGEQFLQFQLSYQQLCTRCEYLLNLSSNAQFQEKEHNQVCMWQSILVQKIFQECFILSNSKYLLNACQLMFHNYFSQQQNKFINIQFKDVSHSNKYVLKFINNENNANINISHELLTKCINNCFYSFANVQDKINSILNSYQFLNNIFYYGKIPKKYDQYSNTLQQQLRDTKDQIKLDEQKINNSSEINEQILKVENLLSNKSQMNKFNEVQNLKSFGTNPIDLKQILEAATQMIISNLWGDACSLLHYTMQQCNANEIIEPSYFDQFANQIISVFCQQKTIRILEEQCFECQLQKIIGTFSILCNMQNQQYLFISNTICLIARCILFGFSEIGISSIFIVLNHSAFKIQSTLLQQLFFTSQLLLKLPLSSHYRQQCEILYYTYCTRIGINDTLQQSQFIQRMQIYLKTASKQAFSLHFCLNAMQFLFILFRQRKYQLAAKLIQNLYKDFQVINVSLFDKLFLQIGLCSMKFILNSNEMIKIDQNNNIFDFYQIKVRIETELNCDNGNQLNVLKMLYLLSIEQAEQIDIKNVQNYIRVLNKQGIDIEIVDKLTKQLFELLNGIRK